MRMIRYSTARLVYYKKILFESYCHTIDYIFCDVHFFLSTIAPSG